MHILVIEDTPKHLADARQYANTLAGCTVDFATTLAEATRSLDRNSYDGVISDVFFPDEAGASAETFENAIALGKLCADIYRVHLVFNTAGNHHGRKFDKFLWETPRAVHNDNNRHFLTTGMIIEAYPEDSNAEKNTKQWQAAFRYVLLVKMLLDLPDKGEGVIKDCAGDESGWAPSPFGARLNGFPYGDCGRLSEYFEECTHPFVVGVFQKFNA